MVKDHVISLRMDGRGWKHLHDTMEKERMVSINFAANNMIIAGMQARDLIVSVTLEHIETGYTAENPLGPDPKYKTFIDRLTPHQQVLLALELQKNVGSAEVQRLRALYAGQG